MKIYTKDSLIAELIKIREKGWIQTRRKNNDGGVGNTLEDLLGIKENNLPLPNATELELKAQKKNTTALITLFQMEPSPRAFRFVPSILLPHFGWPHQEAGKKYSIDEKSFRQTINATGYSNRGFRIKVDRQNRKVLVDFNFNKIDSRTHSDWQMGLTQKRLKHQPYWGFDDLFYKVGTKLHNCFLVEAEAKKIDGQLHFHYQNIFMLKRLDLNKFINSLQNGYVYVDFDARTGHNHGTKFRLRSEVLIDLYAEVKQY